MIKLIPINKSPRYNELTKIANWRNQTLHTLRSHCKTNPNNQPRWVVNLDAATEKYFYIYDDNVFIGYCGLDKINYNNNSAEMSLLIGPEFQREGHGKKTVEKLFEIAFEKLGLNRIHIEVYTTSGNWKFWESCGFTIEGLLRETKYLEGKYYDSIVASILKSEWKVKNVN